MIIISLTILANCYSQDSINVYDKNSHKEFLDILTNSKDNLYKDILEKYNAYLENNPENIQVKIERCKFIGNAYLDEYDDYNYNHAEYEACINELYKIYPDNPKVIIFKAQNVYGDSLKIILDAAESQIKLSNDEWKPEQIAEIYYMQAQQNADENALLAITYARKAIKNNDSLDLSLLIAKAYKDLKITSEAVSALSEKIDNKVEPWILKQKADLFLELGESGKALATYERLHNEDSTYIINSDLSKAFSEIGDYKAARVYLLKDTIPEWNKNASIQNLLSFDIEHSPPSQALITYRRMEDLSFYDDFFGVKRIKIFFQDPLLDFSFSDLMHIGVLLLFIVVLFFVPYLWILPVFGIGTYLSRKGKNVKTALPFNWNLKHFWIFSFFYLFIAFVLIILFEYQETINYYFDIITYYGLDEVGDPVERAEITLSFMLLMVIATFSLFNKERIKYLYQSHIKVPRLIVMGLGFVVFNLLFLYVYKSIFGGVEEINAYYALNIRESIIALIDKYGIIATFLLVAVLVPVYEEVIFRGIILSSTEKHIGFISANILQAVFFALIHDSLFLFPFYFLFGIICGYLARKSGGLLGGIIFHSINNSLAILSIYYIMNSKLIPGL